MQMQRLTCFNAGNPSGLQHKTREKKVEARKSPLPLSRCLHHPGQTVFSMNPIVCNRCAHHGCLCKVLALRQVSRLLAPRRFQVCSMVSLVPLFPPPVFKATSRGATHFDTRVPCLPDSFCLPPCLFPPPLTPRDVTGGGVGILAEEGQGFLAAVRAVKCCLLVPSSSAGLCETSLVLTRGVPQRNPGLGAEVVCMDFLCCRSLVRSYSRFALTSELSYLAFSRGRYPKWYGENLTFCFDSAGDVPETKIHASVPFIRVAVHRRSWLLSCYLYPQRIYLLEQDEQNLL